MIGPLDLLEQVIVVMMQHNECSRSQVEKLAEKIVAILPVYAPPLPQQRLDVKLLEDVSKLCQKICNSYPDSPIREVESFAFYIGHHSDVLNPQKALIQQSQKEDSDEN